MDETLQSQPEQTTEIKPGWQNWPGWDGDTKKWREVTTAKWGEILKRNPISQAYAETNRGYADVSLADVEQMIVMRQEAIEELDPDDEHYEEEKSEYLAEIEVAKNTLDDVASGRACDPNYQPDLDRPVLRIQ